ncbi:hypothetical protein [Hansschlegelia zhihuaiae]|uniref:Uncharacterized protein n=1 Tax=Hansschlegelia zhihuaiae TaxID=405005 RepID=A0A4Q0M9T9_9HYPH|nr:hypothetical protein [Hansschlegelia zhihuaiae]RXF69988.1 hypothetical protein EK403_17845 [Hansschlegelia zhihuaiae]
MKRFDHLRIAAMREAGMTHQAIMAELGCSAATVAKAIRDTGIARSYCSVSKSLAEKLALQGLSDQEIADQTRRSVSTIRKALSGLINRQTLRIDRQCELVRRKLKRSQNLAHIGDIRLMGGSCSPAPSNGPSEVAPTAGVVVRNSAPATRFYNRAFHWDDIPLSRSAG